MKFIILDDFLYSKEFLKIKLILNNLENLKKLISTLGVDTFLTFKILTLTDCIILIHILSIVF